MVAQFTVSLDGQRLSVMTPSKRNFTTRGATTTEAALLTRGASQLYISLGDTAADGVDRGAHLSQADGAADLVRSGADGVRRHAVAVGPAAARRRAEAGQGAARVAGGGVIALKQILAFAFAVAVMMGSSAACAVQPDEIMADPVKEARARDLSHELRCMVCQNQSIDDSEAPLARDLRLLVRERIAAGDSDAQVIDFLVARYGEFVLLKPRLERQTLLLWLLPPLALVGGGLALWLHSRRRATAAATDDDPLVKLTRGRGSAAGAADADGERPPEQPA